MVINKGGPRMLLAAVCMSVACHATAQQVNTAQRRYTDDAIVRDLKAGKLTVREAQILRDRRDRAAVRTGMHKTATQTDHRTQPASSGKHAAKKSKAPIQRVARLHGKSPVKGRPGKKKIGKNGGYGAVHVAGSRPHHAVVPRAEPSRTAKVQSSVAPVRKTAVRYIR